MNKNRSNSSTKRKLRSLLLFGFLFFLTAVIPPVVAEVAAPSSIVQTITNPNQLSQQAKKLYQEQKYESALPIWKAAANGYSQAGDRVNQAITLSNLSLTHQQLGQWDAAKGAIASSLKLLKSESNAPLVLARTLDIQGKLERETGDSAAAIESWQQAAKIYPS